MTGDGEMLVRRMWDGVNTGATAAAIMGEVGKLLHPEVEYVNPDDALERGTRRGADDMIRVFENYLAGAGPDATFEIEHLIERGDKVFVRGRLHGVGAARGLDVLGPGIAAIFTVRDNLLSRMEWHWDKEKALSKFEAEAHEA